MAPRSAGTVWYKSPYTYLGVYAVAMIVFLFLGKSFPVMKYVFIAMLLLYVVAAKITVAYYAFKDGAGTGMLCLCIDLYAVYWVFKESENDFLKVFYGLGFALGLAVRFLNVLE